MIKHAHEKNMGTHPSLSKCLSLHRKQRHLITTDPLVTVLMKATHPQLEIKQHDQIKSTDSGMHLKNNNKIQFKFMERV